MTVGGRRMFQVFMMLAGLIAWAVQFTVIYGVTSTICAREWADGSVLGIGIVPAVILFTTFAALGATGGVVLYSLRIDRRSDAFVGVTDAFLNRATLLISALSLVVIVWHGLPALILPACA
jgi:hypothetical protein